MMKVKLGITLSFLKMKKNEINKPRINFSFIFLFFFLIFFFVFIDQVSKYYIRNNFELNESKKFGIFSLTYVTNTGVSFGLFKGFNIIFVIFSFFVLFFLFYKFFKYDETNKMVFLFPLSVLCAGIIGNLIDRIFFGHVIDFIDFHFWPVFNFADSFMTLSVIWLFFISIRKKIEFI